MGIFKLQLDKTHGLRGDTSLNHNVWILCPWYTNYCCSFPILSNKSMIWLLFDDIRLVQDIFKSIENRMHEIIMSGCQRYDLLTVKPKTDSLYLTNLSHFLNIAFNLGVQKKVNNFDSRWHQLLDIGCHLFDYFNDTITVEDSLWEKIQLGKFLDSQSWELFLSILGFDVNLGSWMRSCKEFL